MYFKNLNASFTFGRASKPLGFKLLLQIQVMLEIKSNRHCFFCTLTKYKNILELISIFIVILRTSTFHLYWLFRRLLTKPMYFRENFWDIFWDNYWDNFVENWLSISTTNLWIWNCFYLFLLFFSEHPCFISTDCSAIFSPSQCMGGDVKTVQIPPIGLHTQFRYKNGSFWELS